MALLILIGALLLLMAARARIRRRILRGRPIVGHLTARSHTDATIGLRDPARPL